MGPTTEFVGPTDCVTTQAVARPATLNLVHQLARAVQVHARNSLRQSVKLTFSILFWLLSSAVGICSQLQGAVDPYTSEFEKSPQIEFYLQDKNKQAAAARQEQFRKRVSIRDAVGEDVPLAFSKGVAPNHPPAPQSVQSDSHGIVRQGILLVTLCLLSLGLFTRMLAPKLFNAVLNKLNPWAGAVRVEPSNAAQLRAEDEAFGAFLASFQAGPAVTVSGDMDSSSSRQDAASEFQTKVARLLSTQRSLLQDINRSGEAAVQRRMLADLGREMQSFKGAVSAPDHLPAWQLASALEGLLKQLSDKAGNVTRSTLRTVGGGIELLEKLCQPAVGRDILTEPPVRFLAVDDDMISRTAISQALKKALNQPDLADNPLAALGMATRHAYDVIFLDVQMQGMDGFELCSKIHETPVNQSTPVVFVTCLNDFDAHAQSVLTGGSDLLGKPFLTFEITVKALTLALGRRLQSRNQPARVVGESDPLKRAEPAIAATVNSSKQTDDTDRLNAAMIDGVVVDLADNLEHAFLTRAARHLGGLREHIRLMTEAREENARQEALADFYLALHSLTPKMDSVASHPALRLSAALEGLLKKLLESPQNWTSSALLTIANAVDLLDDLCEVGKEEEFETGTAPRLLVVDDDLVSRRAIGGALQTAFGKPESAENGEAALALATEKTFDLIFLDIQMPGMDGFTACTKIHQTAANRTTPVVFISGQVDFTARIASATHDGNDLIAKPFLISEVTLKALTLILRAQLHKSFVENSTHPLAESAAKIGSQPGRESKRARKRRLARQAAA